jgi:hypothetical protein
MSSILRRDPRGLLPHPSSRYRGTRASLVVLIGLAALTFGRSLVHVLAPDGGAGSIAGIDVAVEGGRNLVALFGQWGWEQLLLSLVTIVILVRYRFLVPFALLLQVLDWGGRMAVGELKPLVVDAPPPGAYGNWILLPVSLAALWFSLPPLPSPGRERGDGARYEADERSSDASAR